MTTFLTFKKEYFIAAILLFVIELLIALFAHDQFIRPYAGDFLVVILIYCFVKAFINAPTRKIALWVLIFSFLVETLQFLDIVNLLGLGKSRIASVVIGTSFEWMDLITYTLGIAFVLVIEKMRTEHLS